LSLHFSDFSTIFYVFSNFQQNSYTIGDSLFLIGPWKDLGSYKYAPSSRLGPWKDLGACNWVPRPIGQRSLPDFASSGDAFGRGGGGARPRAHLGPCGGRSWGGGVVGEGARRRSRHRPRHLGVPTRGAQRQAMRDPGRCCRSLWRCSRARWPKGRAWWELARWRPWRVRWSGRSGGGGHEGEACSL
jgi:hypothetical protein